MNDPNPQFRATGKGYQTRFPDFPATIHNANAWFDNSSLKEGQKYNRIYLFVFGTSTGWNVQGGFGQSATARTFYPKHLGQDVLQIQGVCANQHEYDKLVEFVMYHQQRALGARDDLGSRALQFVMPKVVVKDKFGVPRKLYPAMHYGGYIEMIEAGHQRFRYAVPWTLGLRISNDFLQDVVDMKAYSDKALKDNFLSVFGSRYKGGKAPGQALPMPDQGDGGNSTPDIWSTIVDTQLGGGDIWGTVVDTQNQGGGS